MNNTDTEKATAKSGVVTIIGRPSSGKSTFINAVCGGKVSIVSPMPQTTRNAIRGVFTNEAGQILFIDTPGIHESAKRFNEELRSLTVSNLKESDCILYIIDATRAIGSEEENIMQLIKDQNLENRLVAAINKIDEKNAHTGVIHLMLEKSFPSLKQANRIFEISAKKKEGLLPLIDCLMSCLPFGEFMYPPDFYTDQDVAFRISEIIRESAIANTREEIPHSLYVKIDTMEERAKGKELFVKAFIYVERESQKGIVIGKDARLITAIKQQSLKALSRIFSYHIILSLEVRVDKDWKKNQMTIKTLLGED